MCIYLSHLVLHRYILNYAHYQMGMDFILLFTSALCMNMFNVQKYFVCIVIIIIIIITIIIMCILFENCV